MQFSDGLLAVTRNIDTDESNPMSRFLLHILVAFGELEREMIRERFRAGLRAAKAQGRPLGRPRRAFRRDEAVRLRSQGVSWCKIAKVLDLPMSMVVNGCRSKNQRASRPHRRNTPLSPALAGVPKTTGLRTPHWPKTKPTG
jgi:DNA invertase Pin-like site-specific DNA recombinase